MTSLSPCHFYFCLLLSLHKADGLVGTSSLGIGHVTVQNMLFWKAHGLAMAWGGLCTLGAACGADRLWLRQSSRK